MQLLDPPIPFEPATGLLAPPAELDERAARASLRRQIGKLERDLASVAATAFPRLAPAPAAAGYAGPRLLSLGELESVRDELAARVSRLREGIARDADRQEEKRVLIERMLLEPGRYKWVRVTGEDIGERACKSWHVRPRLGLIGMMMGWWRVKVSSGCPLAVAAGGRSGRQTLRVVAAVAIG